MTEPSVPTKRIKRRPLIWALFIIFVVVPSVWWAWFVMGQTFIHRDYGTILPIGFSIRNILIAFIPLTASMYVLFRK